ncbi:hypothetical protein Tco_0469112 [Tanacetum coccineum]
MPPTSLVPPAMLEDLYNGKYSSGETVPNCNPSNEEISYFTHVPWRGGHMATAMAGIGYHFRCRSSEPAYKTIRT